MNGELLVRADHVSRYFGSHRVVDDICFSIERGEVLGILGPNGAGKSTLMQILSGVLAPTHGSVSIVGHDIIGEDKIAKQHLGFLPEQPPIYNEMTVDEYLIFCGRLHDVPNDRLADALNNCKHRCGLTEVGRHLLGNLSEGYKQRVGIAQAIIHTPLVIILDEPTSGLDPKQPIDVRSLIRELADDHSVILSTHILPEVKSTCTRVLIMNNGKIMLDGDLDSIGGNNEQHTMKIAFHNAPEPEEITAIPGILNAIHISKHHFRISCNNNPEVVATLVETVTMKGWGLFELIPETGSLEELFLRLTHDDVANKGHLS